MRIIIDQLSNGFVITILMQNQGQSMPLYVATFEDVITKLNELQNLAKEQQKSQTSSAGIHIPPQEGP